MNSLPTIKLTRRAKELIELDAKAKPLSRREWEKLTLETARSYYDTQCEAMSRHLESAGNSAFEIGRTLYWVNEQLGNSRAELEAWLAKSEHPRSVSGAYQYIKLYREQDKIRAAGKVPEKISFKAARAIVTEPRKPLIPSDHKARNQRELADQERQRVNLGTRCADMLDWIRDNGAPDAINAVFEAAKRFVREVEARRRRADAVRKRRLKRDARKVKRRPEPRYQRRIG
ncbi:MAG: hypothetical protein JO166_01820 [Deltaproteobacteria bacterium]|nr:hypothetical protein [Deltaproteobacteria bacterium]